MASPFPTTGRTVARDGTLTCGWQGGPDGPDCTTAATWHVAWSLTTPAGFSLVCDTHMALVRDQFVYADHHPAEVNCNMPGTGWLTGNPSRCVPATTDDAAAYRRAKETAQ